MQDPTPISLYAPRVENHTLSEGIGLPAMYAKVSSHTLSLGFGFGENLAGQLVTMK
jgi:hypothetical protein